MNNPLCGDDISMYVDIRNGNIVDLSFDGTGCAISIAVSSLLTEYAKRKSISKIQNLDSSFIQDLIGVQLSPNRLKCALLPLEVLQKALLSYDRSKTQGSK
jgi:nitrogen fixation NifU-like protein